MKKLLLFFVFLLAITMFVAIMPTDAEGEIYNDTVRLHIIANSDTDHDQELKLYIRDKLLDKYSNELIGYSDKAQAESSIASKLDEIKKDTALWIKDRGYSYSVAVTLSTEWYETRVYDGFSLPCGYYTSLRVMIGEAAGQNWWCVLYPPMCLDAATEKNGDAILNYTDEEILLISDGKYKVKFKLLEIFSTVFS